MRIEFDSLGEIEVEDDKYYGAQTARSLKFFSWGKEKMPSSVVRGLILIKKSAAKANSDLNKLEANIKDMIVQAADTLLSDYPKEHFPLYVWQTGSGTQSNMNVNEVISNLAILNSGGVMGSKKPIHPNDHVNMSQSSNDVFPAAMHIAAVMEIYGTLIPSLDHLSSMIEKKVVAFKNYIKIGRTHLMDAVPMSLGQEFSGYLDQLYKNKKRILLALDDLMELSIGATAIGTGINVPEGFVEKFLQHLNEDTGFTFIPASNYFSALSCHDALVHAHGALVTLACSLLKLSTDLSFLGSGPRCGFGELILPENEPGSSIMPGKINPTQCEALSMVCAQVIGNNQSVITGGSRGNFELNVMKPVIIYNFLQSIQLLSEGMISFADNFVEGLQVNKRQLDYFLNNSLMLVTALSPIIGYDKCSKIALKAFHENLTLKEACLALEYMQEDEYDRIVKPENMIGNR